MVPWFSGASRFTASPLHPVARPGGVRRRLALTTAGRLLLEREARVFGGSRPEQRLVGGGRIVGGREGGGGLHVPPSAPPTLENRGPCSGNSALPARATFDLSASPREAADRVCLGVSAGARGVWAYSGRRGDSRGGTALR